MVAKRGRNGGINLSRNPKYIYLTEIIDAIDGPPPEKENCAIGLDLCSDESPCPLHHKWKPIRTDIREMLAAENLNYKEIAKTIDIPIGTVESRLFNCRKELKGLMAQ